jgi:hypothetical protein
MTATAQSESSLKDWRTLSAAACFGLLIWLLLPAIVVALDDDFSYLRSVIQTIQHDRPWTDNWLTPWAASCSALSALLYHTTGSFSFAIHFNLVLAGTMAFAGLMRHLRDQGVSTGKAIAFTAAVLTFPSVMNMHLLFTAVALYWGCLWLCLCLAYRRQWLWFFLFWAVALSSRQSAITWLGIPGCVWLEHVWRSRSLRGVPRDLWIVLVGGVIWFGIMMTQMNPTQGQEIATRARSLHVPIEITLRTAGLSLLALIAGFGSRRLAAFSAPVSRSRLIIAIVCGLGGAAFAIWITRDIIAIHNCLGDAFAPWIIGLVGAVAAAGIVLSPICPRWEVLPTIAGAIALLLLYRADFDYYYVDLVAWGIYAASRKKGSTVTSSRPEIWFCWLLSLCLVAILTWNARCLLRLKLAHDISAGVITTYEKAIRESKLGPQDIGMAPFGYQGWHLADYFLANEGRVNNDLSGFVAYTPPWNGQSGNGVVRILDRRLKPFSTWLMPQNNVSLRSSMETEELIEHRGKVLWFYKATYQLMSKSDTTPRAGRITVNPQTFQPQIFPLTDAEWRRQIEAR